MNNQELQADLAKVAAEYNHSVLQQAVLENYKDSILLLRAKFASYEKIAELLNERGIKVSVATVRKFCRKYLDEAQRLRTEIADERRGVAPARRCARYGAQ
jgi:transposase-like protein